MSDAPRSSFTRRVGPLVAARFVSAGITLSIPLVLARSLSLPDYGTYKQLFLVFQTLYFILPFGVPASLYFFVPRTSAPRPYFSQTLAYLFAAGVVAALILSTAAPSISTYFSNPGLLELRWPLALYTGAMLAACPLESSLTARGRMRVTAVVVLVSDSARAAAMVVPILLGWGLHGLMAAVLGVALLRLVAAWALMLGDSEGPWWSREALRAQAAYALPFGAAMALAIPQQYFHQYVVSGAVTPELFAIYAVGCFQLPIVDLLYTPTSEVLMVQIAELEREGRAHEAAAAFREASAKLSYVFIPASVFLFVAAPEFIGALFGERFLAAVPLFRVTVLGVVLATLPLDGALRARNETRHIFLSYLVKAGATVPLVLVGVRLFGLIGGVASWTLAEVIGKAFLLARLPRALSTASQRTSLAELIPFRALFRALGSAGVAALGLWALRAYGSAAWSGLPAGVVYRALPLLLAAVLFGAGYLALAGIPELLRKRGQELTP